MNSDPQFEEIINKLSRRYCILFYLSIEEYELTNTIDSAILWSKLNKISRTKIKIAHLSNNFIYNQLRFNNQDMDVGGLSIVAMILRNALVPLNGNENLG
jgi:hypothetical protein